METGASWRKSTLWAVCLVATGLSALGKAPECRADEGHCKGGSLMSRPDDIFRSIRRFLAGPGFFPRKLLHLKQVSEGSEELGLFVRRGVKAGALLLEVPLSHVLWRRTAVLADLHVELRPNAFLSDVELITLTMAILRRRVTAGGSVGRVEHFRDYAATLASPSDNSTLFWSISETNLLRGTDAGELTDHYNARLAAIMVAAPRAATLEELREAFLLYQSRHVRLDLSKSGRLDAAMIPALDLCRAQEGGGRVSLRSDGRAIQLRAWKALKAGEEVVVDFGPRDLTDEVVLGLRAGAGLGVFLPVPLDADMNGGIKTRILEQLRWPSEVRLFENEVRDLKVLRLAAMPQEEFTAWSVGAMAAGTPLSVSRGFRTEVQATAYLLSECVQRMALIRAPAVPAKAKLPHDNQQRFRLARAYRSSLLTMYGRCEAQARTKLAKLEKWAQKQHEWARIYVEEAIWRADRQAEAPLPKLQRPFSAEPPEFLDQHGVEAQLMYSTIAALVNTKAQEFAPFFSELMRSPQVKVAGFVDMKRRLRKVRKLAGLLVQLKGPGCGGVDLSAFEWINELRGDQDVYTALKYVLPEMGDLVQEFMELERLGEVPIWR